MSELLNPIEMAVLGPAGKRPFSPREKQIAALDGWKSNKEIAEMLSISKQTVKNHKVAIHRKMGNLKSQKRENKPKTFENQDAFQGEPLTELEENVADCVSPYWTDEDIAQELGISLSDVKENLQRIYTKLGIGGYKKRKKLHTIQLAKAHRRSKEAG